MYQHTKLNYDKYTTYKLINRKKTKKLAPAQQSSEITEIENSSENYKCLPTLTNETNLFKSSLFKVSTQSQNEKYYHTNSSTTPHETKPHTIIETNTTTPPPSPSIFLKLQTKTITTSSLPLVVSQTTAPFNFISSTIYIHHINKNNKCCLFSFHFFNTSNNTATTTSTSSKLDIKISR